MKFSSMTKVPRGRKLSPRFLEIRFDTGINLENLEEQSPSRYHLSQLDF